MQTFTLYACLLICGSALAILAVRLRLKLTPFHLCIPVFMLELWLTLHPLMIDDEYGRTKLYPLLPQTQVILLGAAFTFLACAVYLKAPAPGRFQWRINTLVPKNAIVAVALLIVIASSLIGYQKLGGFPLFVLGEATRGGQLGYSDVFQGFSTFVGWGAVRFLAYYLILEIALAPKVDAAFLRSNFVLIGGTAAGLFFNALDGQRNMVILLFIAVALVLSQKGWLRTYMLLPAIPLALAYFLYVGAIRGSYLQWSERVNVDFGVPMVNELIGWGVSYVEPNIHNLNNLVSLSHSRSYGIVALTQVLPDTLVGRVFAIPPDAPTILWSNQMYSHPGLTFRTVYADYYPDFGMVGSVFLGAILCVLCVVCFNRANQHPRYMLGYITLIVGIVWLPAHNILIGIPAMFPLLLFGVLRFERCGVALDGSPALPGGNARRLNRSFALRRT